MEANVLEKHFRVPIVKFDSPNSNGRIYPSEILPKLQKLCDDKRFCGIHAETSFRDRDIPLEKIGAAVESLEVIDNIVYADILLLETPSGFILQELRRTGELAARLFGIGNIDEAGKISNFEPLGISVGLEKDMAVL